MWGCIAQAQIGSGAPPLMTSCSRRCWLCPRHHRRLVAPSVANLPERNQSGTMQ